MLARQLRLKKSQDFTQLYRKGKRYSSGWVVLIIAHSRHKETRVGFVVPNHVIRLAVERNRIRRQLRSIVAQNFDLLPRGANIVFSLKAHPPTKLIKDLRSEITSLMKRTDLSSKQYAKK